MNRTTALLVVGLLMTGTAFAQTSAEVQAGATAQSQSGVSTSAGTERSGEQLSGAASTATAANASANAGQNSFALADGTTLNAALSNSLDAKKSKSGDKVVARTTESVKQNGKVVLPKGTRLVGHVTQAQAREKGTADSSLGVVFDHAELRNGEQVPLSAGVQALAASQTAAQAAGADDLGAGGDLGAAGGGRVSGGRGLVGGAAGGATGSLTNVAGSATSTASGTVGAAAGATGRSTAAVGGLNGAGVLTSNSRGVFGLDGLSLDSAASSATQGSLIVSKTQNVRLASGTQMLLRVAAAK